MSEIDDVLDRVRKLLALATSPNVHEAAAAAGRAQALIAQHRLQDRLAASRVAEDDPDPIVDAWHEPLAVARRNRRWKVALACALAELNGCVAYTARRERDEIVALVGRGRDRAAVAALWGDLVPRIEWLSATHGAGRSRAWHDAFRLGAVDAIVRGLTEGGSSADSTVDPSALATVEPRVRAEREQLDRFVAEHLSLRRGRSAPIDARAYQRGQEAVQAEVSKGSWEK